MVIINDRLSDLASKGEVTERYYNPGDLFGEVHLVIVNDDRPDPAAVQKMVGSAKLYIHNLPSRQLCLKTLGWRPWLLQPWAERAVDLARVIQPSLVRCHGVFLNAFAASRIKRSLGIPYVVSVHTNPDLDMRYHPKREGGWLFRAQQWLSIAIENESLRDADCVVCVYRFLESYAARHGARRIEVIYNVINTKNLLPKTGYSLHSPPSLVVIGRQYVKKDPRPVLFALKDIAGLRAVFIGDGPYHEELRQIAAQLDIKGRCTFIRSQGNEELCRSLKDYDLLVSVNDCGGVSKVELEAALAGMPVITNRHHIEPEPEILGQSCIVVDGDPESYQRAIRQLLADQDLRERLGTRLRASVADLRGDVTEASYVALYRELAKPREAPVAADAGVRP